MYTKFFSLSGKETICKVTKKEVSTDIINYLWNKEINNWERKKIAPFSTREQEIDALAKNTVEDLIKIAKKECNYIYYKDKKLFYQLAQILNLILS